MCKRMTIALVGVFLFMLHNAATASESVAVSPINVGDIREGLIEVGGTWRLINIWATWCQPCVHEIPALVKISEKYAGRGLNAITLSIDRPEHIAAVQAFLAKHGAPMRNLLVTPYDIKGVQRGFNYRWPGAVPFTVLVSPSNSFVYIKRGAFDAEDLDRHIDRFLPSKPGHN